MGLLPNQIKVGLLPNQIKADFRSLFRRLFRYESGLGAYGEILPNQLRSVTPSIRFLIRHQSRRHATSWCLTEKCCLDHRSGRFLNRSRHYLDSAPIARTRPPQEPASKRYLEHDRDGLGSDFEVSSSIKLAAAWTERRSLRPLAVS